jgi:hypothetical protein
MHAVHAYLHGLGDAASGIRGGNGSGQRLPDCARAQSGQHLRKNGCRWCRECRTRSESLFEWLARKRRRRGKNRGPRVDVDDATECGDPFHLFTWHTCRLASSGTRMPSRFIWAAAAALVPLAALILGTLWKQSTAPSSHAVAVLERHSIGRDLLSMPSSEENSYGYFLHRAWLSRPKPDVTAVILNWARFPNVLDIVAVLCHPILAETIAEIFVWNNAPQKITVEVCSRFSGFLGDAEYAQVNGRRTLPSPAAPGVDYAFITLWRMSTSRRGSWLAQRQGHRSASSKTTTLSYYLRSFKPCTPGCAS